MTDPVRVCFLGDSFMLGRGDHAGLGWAGRVANAAFAANPQFTGYNLGVRGQTGAEILVRAEAELAQRLDGLPERLGVVLSFGANDVRLQRPVEETASAAEALLHLCAAKGYAAFFVSPPPAEEPANDAVRAVLTRRLAEVCAAAEVPFQNLREADADWSVWHAECRAGDGAHPDAGGYVMAADLFERWPPWRRWLTGLEP